MVKNNIELGKCTDGEIVIKGKKLRVEWLDSYILVWSEKEHPYRKR
jgi:hypothetical protein